MNAQRVRSTVSIRDGLWAIAGGFGGSFLPDLARNVCEMPSLS